MNRQPRDHALWSWGHTGYYAREARELVEARQNGLRWASAYLKRHLPDGAASTPLTEKEARRAVAAELQFNSWEELSERVVQLGEASMKGGALQAAENADAEALEKALEKNPEAALAVARDNNTLLEIVVDLDAPFKTKEKMARALIQRGAEMSKALWTNDLQARDMLIEAGALNESCKPAFLSMKSNMMHADCANAAQDWLNRGVEPVGFWMNAAAGRIEPLQRSFQPEGQLLPEAAETRPNLADIGWWEQTGRSDDPREILGEALCMALLNGRLDAAQFLLDQGADAGFAPPGLGGWRPLDFAAYAAFPDDGLPRNDAALLIADRAGGVNEPDSRWNAAPLTWAAWRRNAPLAYALLERGAVPDNVAVWGTTALHYAAQRRDIPLVKALVEAGARLDIRDKENNGAPLDWAGGDSAPEELRALLT
ncbi:MAG: ankyrin repeat domain-containing protein [Candidatus Poribacteria bacterium]|nr:ankyrin repeat domain-containing protein [Candidatus Poribacteria bacterium]